MRANVHGLRPTYETAPGVFVDRVTDHEQILSVRLEPYPETEGTGDNGADGTPHSQGDPVEAFDTDVHVREQVFDGQRLPYILAWYMQGS